MLNVRLATDRGTPAVLALPVRREDPPVLLPTAQPIDEATRVEAEAMLRDVEHTGAAGVLHTLPRPVAQPRRLYLVGVGHAPDPGHTDAPDPDRTDAPDPDQDGTAGWRAVGAALCRAAQRDPELTVGVPAGLPPAAVSALTEGLLLAAYRYRLSEPPADAIPKLETVTLVVDDPARYEQALDRGRTIAEYTCFARDLTNTPSDRKNPAWFAEQVGEQAADLADVSVTVREPDQLRAEGFGGILAVGAGSASGPRLVELSYQPADPRLHVVLVGKGITFDTGGICIKPRDGMRLMRKDMGGAAAVTAATLAAARLRLPVRITALAPLAENMVSGDAFRPGDVIRHYGGRTSEILNTDAEGRVVLADALAYAAERLDPDLLVDLATLTGAQNVALGKRTAALFAEDRALADGLRAAGAAVGEQMWRLPMPDDYVADALRSDFADMSNAAAIGAGSVTAAIYLREFTGSARRRWAHIDMSAPAWTEKPEGELVKGATGWGVRTLLHWLETLDRPAGR